VNLIENLIVSKKSVIVAYIIWSFTNNLKRH
jgi:hypothetical protein